MRKIITVILLISIISVSVSGCFGSFALTRKVYDLNQSFGDKWIQSIGMWVMCIVPIYGFSAFVDIVVLNLIEFWTGDNPLAMGEDESSVRLYAHEGREFEVTTTRNRYDFVEIGNPSNAFAFVFEGSSWFLHANDEIIMITQDTEQGLFLYGLEGEVLARF